MTDSTTTTTTTTPTTPPAPATMMESNKPSFTPSNNIDYFDFDDPYRDENEVTDEMLDLELLAAWGQLPSSAQVTTQYTRKANEEAFTKVDKISETEGRTNLKANADVLDSLNSPDPEDPEDPDHEPTPIMAIPTPAAAANSISKLMNAGASGDSNAMCYKCGKVGHLRKDCPDAKGESSDDYRMSDAICYRCGLNGHISRDCKTDLRLLRVGMRCIYCGKSGHKRYNCPLLPKDAVYVPETKRAKLSGGEDEREVITLDSSSEDEKGDAVVISDGGDEAQKGTKKNELKYCYNCGQKGHYGDECKKPKMDSFGSLPFPNNKRNRDWFKKIGYEERVFGPRISVNEDYGLNSFIESDPYDSHRGSSSGNNHHHHHSSSSSSSRPITPQPPRQSHGGTPTRVKTPSRSPPPFSGSSSKKSSSSGNNSKGGSSPTERKGGRFGSGFKRNK